MLKIKVVLTMMSVLSLFGCDVFENSDPLGLAKSRIKEMNKKAEKNAIKYKENMVIPEVREIKAYSISSTLDDPFIFANFAYREEVDIVDGQVVKVQSQDEKDKELCVKTGDCVDPPLNNRRKSFLENYSLESLQYSGLMEKQRGNLVGLVKTPNVGVVKVKVGDFIGQDGGEVLKILPNALVIQETVKQGNIWRKLRRNILVSN